MTILQESPTMNSKLSLNRIAVAAVLAIAASASFAAETRSGTIGFHNDVRTYDFTLSAAGTVDIVSTSWQYGLNFDPAAAVWMKSGSDYTLVDQNDDDAISAYDPLGNYNFRLNLNLGAGDYKLSVFASFSDSTVQGPAGTLLSQGFIADGQAPIALADWTQPSSDINKLDQKGGFYSFTIDGAGSVAAVPEPSTWLLMGVGVAGLLLRRRAA
jgi:hypothetical protein